MTPTGIEALLAHVELLHAEALRGAPFAQHDYSLAVVAAFPQILAHIRSQSRALAEREREADRMRYYLKLVLDVGQDDETRDVTLETAISLAQTWAGLALASAPKGEGEGTP
jgi:hypothetical protein